MHGVSLMTYWNHFSGTLHPKRRRVFFSAIANARWTVADLLHSCPPILDRQKSLVTIDLTGMEEFCTVSKVIDHSPNARTPLAGPIVGSDGNLLRDHELGWSN